MKWRCAWCGKPHEANDPPCDSCGHGTFEEAVVREQEFETVDTGTQYEWICSNCGRQHVKNNPPCSRCGNHDLEKVEQTFDVDSDLEVPTWLEVAKPYTPIIVVLVVVAGLFATGIIPLSVILPQDGPPSPPEAPEDADAAAAFDLEAVEQRVHERLESERDADASRAYDDGLAGIAEYMNRQNVVERYDGTRPEDADWSEFGPSCAGTQLYSDALEGGLSIDDYTDEETLAEDIAAELVGSSAAVYDVEGLVSEGIDVHVGPDGALFVFYVAC